MSSAAFVAPASAAIVTQHTPGFVQPAENVLLNSGQTGTTITGNTNPTNTSVTFRSLNGETLTAPSNGQARVETIDDTLDTLASSLIQRMVRLHAGRVQSIQCVFRTRAASRS